MSKESLLQTKLSPDIINIILKYELTLDNLNKKIKPTRDLKIKFTSERMTKLLIRALSFGYYGIYMSYSNQSSKGRTFNYLNKLIKDNNLNDKIEISIINDYIVIHLKNIKLNLDYIINVQCIVFFE
jgi:hypothetical protein